MRQMTAHELGDLVRWFTHHMSQETRRQLMGDLPRHYAMLYPHVSPQVLASKVAERITEVSGQSSLLPETRANIP